MPVITVRTKPCPRCGETKDFVVDKERFYDWQKRICSIQEAFPTMPPGDRERFLSGYCPKCWEEEFAKFDKEE